MINFRVSGDGHDMENVTAGPREVLKWEAAFPNASMMQFLSSYRLTELYQIAYVTLKTRNHPIVQAPSGGFITMGEFLDTMDVQPGHIEIGQDSDPTRPGVSPDQ
jgi:hypothetical protein